MTEVLQNYGMVFLVSMTPLAELRGAIPLGVMLDLPPFGIWLVSVLGNMVPVPFIILFIREIFCWMERRGGKLAGLVHRLRKKAERNAELFYKYELLGLLILVAIPLPGTGAWTGALLAALLDIRLKNAMLAIAGGVIGAGLIVTGVTYGFSALL